MNAAVDKALHTLGGGGIFLVQCMKHIQKYEAETFDRVLVFTDEQDCDLKLNPAAAPRLGSHNYIVNIAADGVGIDISQGWVRINGWSDRVVDWLRMHEEAENLPVEQAA